MSITLKQSLHTLFMDKKGWELQKSNPNTIYYTKRQDETNYVEIRFLSQTIIVSVPIKNSIYQFSSTFDNSDKVLAFIENHV